MRLVRFLFFYALLSVFGITLIAFLAQNRRVVRIDLFGPEITINLAWVLLGAAVFGAVIVLVLLLPGRIAISLLAWRLERELRQLEHDLWRLQAQRERLLERHDHTMEAHERLLLTYQRLVDEYNRVLAEREQARARVAVARVASAGSPSPAATRAQEPAALPRLSVISPASTASTAANASLASRSSAESESLAAGPRADGVRSIQSAQPAMPEPRQVPLVPVTSPTAAEGRNAPNTALPAAIRDNAPHDRPQQTADDANQPIALAEPRRIMMEVGLAPVLVDPGGTARVREAPSALGALSARLRDTRSSLVAFITARRGQIDAQLARLGQRTSPARPALSVRSSAGSVAEETDHNRRQTDGIEDPAHRQ
ncbi:MAG TPA: LapA family protein [Ktedonobacterales bacterium]|nr:LapA family protein [Ktedonobacterales bacterium]